MKSNRIVFLSIVFMILCAVTLICSTASGQNVADDSEFTLEPIIVTAEFRERTIQETPLSITAVNADMMEARSQISLDQISAQAPGVTLRPNNSGMGGSLVAYIRGVGQSDFNSAVEAGVGIYVDDVYYSTITGNILELLDLERVEILRGPQGTLAGRNAIGGAIKLFTRKPDEREDGYMSLTYGSYNRLDLKAAGGVTIVPDRFFARVAGVSRSRDGYVTRLDYARHNNLPPPGMAGGFPTYAPLGGSSAVLGKEGGQSMTSGRLSLRWVPSDRFEINFTANIVNDKSESQPSVLISAVDNTGSSFPFMPSENPYPAFSPNFNPESKTLVPIFFENAEAKIADNVPLGVYHPDYDVGYDSRFVTGGTYYNYSTYINDGRSTPSPIYQGYPGQDNSLYKPHVLPPINHFQSKDYNISFNWQLADNVSLLSVTSYREYENIFADDTDGSPLALNQLLQRMNHEQWTQELRLNAAFSLWDLPVALTLGGFYLDKETNEDARVDINYAAFDFFHGPDIVPSKSKALYGQWAMGLTERTNMTLGLRHSRDEKSYTFHRHNPDGTPVSGPPTVMVEVAPGVFIPAFWFAGNPANSGVFGLDGISISYASNRWDYRGAIDYSLTDNVMIYGQVATGYKMGGNNARPFFPSQLYATDPEELINYEIGIKSTLFDQLRLNATAFFNDYKDIQLMVERCAWAPEAEQTPCASVANVGDAEVKGFELEALWRPTRAVSVDFSYAYTDFKYTKMNPDTGISLDSSAPFTPKHKWSLGAQYRFELGRHGDLTPRIDVAFEDDVYTAALNASSALVPSKTTANGRLTWRSHDFKWQAAMEVTNITNKYYYLTIFDLNEAAGYVNAQPSRPREWALTIRRSWFWD